MEAFKDFIANREWVAYVVFLETMALSITEATGVLPDGDAKVYVIVAAGFVTMWTARLRSWSKATVDALVEQG